MRFYKTAILMIMACALVVFYFDSVKNPALLEQPVDIKKSVYANSKSISYEKKKDPIHFAVIACKDDNPSQERGKWDKLLYEMQVMFKSAALLTSEPIYINTITYSPKDHEDIVNLTQSWNSKYRDRLVFKSYKGFYPEGFDYLENDFTKCASLSLFLMDMLPDLESVIFIDADTIFHRPPRELWDHFYNFDDIQVAGVTPNLYMYNEKRNDKRPHFGNSGLNSGIVMYNLTRMKHFPGGWHQSIRDVIKKYPKSRSLGDQDILNAIFSGSGEKYAYEIVCEWNYQWRHCGLDRNRCANAAAWGVALLHGAGMAFLSNEEYVVKAVFDGWAEYSLGNPVGDLVSLIENNLEQAKKDELKMHEEAIQKKSRKKIILCYRITNINDIFLKGLKKHLAFKYNYNNQQI